LSKTNRETKTAESVPAPQREPLLVSLKEAARLGVLPYRIVGNKWLVSFKAVKAFANDVKGAAWKK
jgi:hypothetical protein